MARMQQARAVEFERFGGAEVLELVDIDMPEPGDGEVLVEVVTAGINHIEAFVRAGRLGDDLPSSLPQRQGSDFAGIVRAVGAGVTGVKRGAEVLGHVARGAQATHLVVPASQLVLKPRDLTWEVAGSLFLAGVVAADIVDELRLGADDTVVISAAAGGVGSIEAQLAMAQGARVIGTCGERNRDYLRSLGIRPVVYGDGVVERIRAEAPNGVTAFIDNFGQDGHELAAALGVPTQRYRSSDDRKRLEVAALREDADAGDVAQRTRQLQRLADLAAKHSLSLLVSGFYPFEQVREAYDDLEKLHARGKIVLGMQPVNRFTTLKARELDESRP